ncbi:MAG: DUF5695 domain-containing protein [Acidobacteriaceae bacterium]|nr:DUF5695 domain-containing protein [Acidobacteriaceae bacterium]
MTLRGSMLSLSLLRSSGTVAKLTTTADPSFDYTQGDRLKERSADTFYHLGDLDLRLRSEGETEWKDYSTAYRRKPVQVTRVDEKHFVANLAPTLPGDTPLEVMRSWEVTPAGLRLSYTLLNKSDKPVHIGGLGIPMVFNNNMNDRTLEQAYKQCSFYDPYIGEDAGYVQVVRLQGTGPVLLLVPDGHTPFEAWKPILDHRNRETGSGELLNDPTPRGMTYEGSYDWMIHSGGFAETDWKKTTGKTPEEWNPATEEVLAPGQSVQYGLQVLVAPSVRDVEATLSEHHRPVAVGVPGYVLPQDTPARLFLRYGAPVSTIKSEPEGAVKIHDDGAAADHDWHAYTLQGATFGRARIKVTYADGTVQSIAYRTIKAETQTVADMGSFLFHEQWFDDKNDPFHRSPSIMSYDDEAGKILTQEPRVWIAGLSDEGGAGSYLAAAMKEELQPNKEEVAKLERFVNETVWGHLQENDGEGKYGVHKSLFYYDPQGMPAGYYDPSYNWKNWTSWNKKDSSDLGRTYNYPHVVAAYWALYHVARNSQGLVTEKSWQWYLDQAYETSMAMKTLAPYYTQFGLMEGTVFLQLLEDLKAEGWTDKANTLEAFMRERASHWQTEEYPFGSEMPWDSTGQEEVYDWSAYFGMKDKATVTLNAILAYTPVEPSWGYNGSARRFWDFLYGGKYSRIERQLHHYGSGLNAIPLLMAYRAHPDDLYLLRAGYGGVMGPLTNIDSKGFASAAFHSYPDRMAFDPYTGDYGPNFFGHAMNTGTYLVHDPRFGWLGFGGTVQDHADSVSIRVTDSSRSRLFIAPAGLWVTLEEGQIDSASYEPKTGKVSLTLAPATQYVAKARIHVQATTPSAKTYSVMGAKQAGSYAEIDLATDATTLTLMPLSH